MRAKASEAQQPRVNSFKKGDELETSIHWEKVETVTERKVLGGEDGTGGDKRYRVKEADKSIHLTGKRGSRLGRKNKPEVSLILNLGRWGRGLKRGNDVSKGVTW